MMTPSTNDPLRGMVWLISQMWIATLPLVSPRKPRQRQRFAHAVPGSPNFTKQKSRACLLAMLQNNKHLRSGPTDG